MDDIVEGTEIFELELALPISMKYAIKLANPSRVTVAIKDASSMYAYYCYFFPPFVNTHIL